MRASFMTNNIKTPLVITGAFKGTSRERLYQELGLESLRKMASEILDIISSTSF